MAPPSYDFDAIVVGSGFGGSIAALRLSEAGRRVSVLERGRPADRAHFDRVFPATAAA